MIPRWPVLLAVSLVAFATRPLTVLTTVRGESATEGDLVRVSPALKRGIAADSSLGIEQDPRSPAAPRGARMLVLVMMTVTSLTDSLVVQVQPVSVLGQAVVPVDTLRIARAALDKELTDYGSRLAVRLRKRYP